MRGATLLWLCLVLPACTPQPSGVPTDKPTPVTTVSQSQAGNPVVEVPEMLQKRLGLQVAPLTNDPATDTVEAYGAIEEDPGQRSVLAAPLAGILHSQNWPHLGETIQSQNPVGSVEARVLPVERAQLRTQRLDFATRLEAARADVAQARALEKQTLAEIQGARAVLQNSQLSVERLQKLNADDKNVSDRALLDARQRLAEASARVSFLEARLGGERARHQAALRSATLLADNLPEVAQLEASRPLVAASEGEVVEILAHPGQSVEAGQVLLRLVSYRRVLARVEIPVGRRLQARVKQAVLKVPGDPRSFVGRWVAASGAPAGTLRGQSLLFRLEVADQSLRPGTPVIAKLSAGTQLLTPSIPPAARLVEAGRTYVYRQIAPERFERVEIQPSKNLPAPGDRLVVAGAQLLLSQERKSSLQVLQEGGE